MRFCKCDVNFVKMRFCKMWILRKMMIEKCEFCEYWDFEIVHYEKWDFENVNFVKKWDYENVNFWYKVRIFAPEWQRKKELQIVLFQLILFAVDPDRYSSIADVGTGIWTGVLFGVAGGLGLNASQRPSHCS